MSKTPTIEALDRRFRHWLTFQPSCLDGAWSEVDDIGDFRNVACHTRRARHSGTSIKPLFNCTPLTDAQHRLQSNGGELACLRRYLPHTPFDSVDAAKAWFDAMADRYREKWLKTLTPELQEIVRRAL